MVTSPSMDRLRPVDARDDIPARYRDTPVERLLACHQLGADLEPPEAPELLVATCMDHRVSLRIPRDFAYLIRTGGASLAGRDFEVSFAVAVGGVRAVAVVGHSDCGMAAAPGQGEAFVRGLVEWAGWDEAAAEDHFEEGTARHAIDDPVEFTLEQVGRLRHRWPEILVAPLHYGVEDRRLYVVRE